MILKAQDLSLKIKDKTLFSSISLSLDYGQKIAIIAPNGSGKTSLLELLAGLRIGTSGQITLFNKQIRSLDDYKGIRAKIGYLFQDSNQQFICPNVLEDVAFSVLTNSFGDLKLSKQSFKSAQANALQKAAQMLDLLGLSALKDSSPYALSGGQKRLVAIAGVLAFSPELMILGEPESSLDTHSKAKIASILKQSQSAIIFSSHDTSFASALAHKVYYLKEKALVEKII